MSWTVRIGLAALTATVASCTSDESSLTDETETASTSAQTTDDEPSTSGVTGADTTAAEPTDGSGSGVTTAPQPVCGDGILEGVEECDDGNDIDGDGCDTDCTLNLDTSIWQNTYAGQAMVRESGHGVAVDSLGNVIVGGYAVDVIGNPDMWIAKYDPAGVEQWTLQLDPSEGLDDRIYAVTTDVFDNIVLVGDVDVSAASSDIWVARLDPEGDMQWSTTFDGPMAQNDGGRGVATDAEGNVLVTGFVRAGDNDNDIFVAHLTPLGGTDWTDIVAGPDVFDDRGQAIGTDPEGNGYVAGFVSHGGFDRSVWLRKYDREGAPLWTEQWDAPNNADDAGFGLAVAPDGSVAVAGQTPVTGDNQDVWLGRFSGDGEYQWHVRFGGPAVVNDQGFAVAADANNDFIVVGYRGMSETDSDIWMRKYDVGGNVLWSQVVAGRGNDRDQATAVATDAELNIVVAGEIRNATSSDGDIWVGKFGPG